MADYIKISAFLDLASLEALLLKCVAKELQESETMYVLCSLPYLNNYTVNDQSLSDMQK